MTDPIQSPVSHKVPQAHQEFLSTTGYDPKQKQNLLAWDGAHVAQIATLYARSPEFHPLHNMARGLPEAASPSTRSCTSAKSCRRLITWRFSCSTSPSSSCLCRSTHRMSCGSFGRDVLLLTGKRKPTGHTNTHNSQVQLCTPFMAPRETSCSLCQQQVPRWCPVVPTPISMSQKSARAPSNPFTNWCVRIFQRSRNWASCWRMSSS